MRQRTKKEKQFFEIENWQANSVEAFEDSVEEISQKRRQKRQRDGRYERKANKRISSRGSTYK